MANDLKNIKHLLEPDFSRPKLQIPENMKTRMRNRLERLYGPEQLDKVYNELERVLIVHHAYITPELEKEEKSFNVTQRFTEKDVILITYGDLVESKDKSPLATLAEFTNRLFRGLITTLHILPFYPYSSDRGFAVVNYQAVDPRFGTWEDIIEMKHSFKLMFDGVINHCSAKSKWFRRFLCGETYYNDYFISYDSPDAIDSASLKKILRPRTSNLLTRFETINGPKYVWTTFSDDQVDLNFKSPKVFMKIIRILLDYVRRGADIIRLDAITYLWRELGTSCAHLEQTHEVVKLLRDVLDVVAPHVALITETNVPHKDNVTYFGDGRDEAQMVYNFALPPLVLHTFLTGDSTALSGWAADLEAPSDTTTFFNFLDSHDGIGILGAKGILDDTQVDNLCESIKRSEGFVSMKSNGDGTESPYELNTTWFSALNPPCDDDPVRLQVDRYVASRAVALVMRGVPGIYMLGMFASKNDLEAVSRDGVKRSINRATIYEDKLMAVFMDRNSIERRIVDKFMVLLELRVNETAFHPNASQEIIKLGTNMFGIKRVAPDGNSEVFCFMNVTSESIDINISVCDILGDGEFYDMITEQIFSCDDDKFSMKLRPYQIVWLKKS